MSHSLNEVRALSIRAARGAGLDWGMAEEAGFAVRWLAGAALPGAMLLARRLSEQGVGDTSLPPLRVAVSDSEALEKASGENASGEECDAACPLFLGAEISDRAHQFRLGTRQSCPRIVCPLLLMPFLSNVARQRGTTVSVLWSSHRLLVGSSSLCLYEDGAFRQALEKDFTAGLGTDASADIEWLLNDAVASEQTDAAESTYAQPQRAPLDDQTRECLTRLASLTYAPATDDSRRLGAGGAD